MLWYNTGINGYTQYKHFYYNTNESDWIEVAIDTDEILESLEKLAWKDEVVAATTTNITISTALNSGNILDGITLSTGNRVLVKNQTIQAENGIYIVGTSPVRSDDMNESVEFNNAIVPVQEGGTSNGGTMWRCTTINPTVGSTNIVFTTFALVINSASESDEGIAYIATQVEVTAETDDTKIITPLKMGVILNIIRSSIQDISAKLAVNVASTSNIDLSTIANGSSLDGITLSTGDRILAKDQTDQSENGIYIIGATAGSTVRSTDMDESSEFAGALIFVLEGTQNEYTRWFCITESPTVDTTNIEFIQASPDSSETVRGEIEIADESETEAEVDDTKALTPAKVKLLLDPIRAILNALTPDPPQNLSGLTITMTLYTALEAGTGSIHSDCIDDTTPDGSVADFYNGDSGTLSAEIDGSPDGSRVLSSADDTGTYTSLIITADEDPYLSQFGEGLYKQLSATIRAAVALTYAAHTYQLKHSATGDSALKSFHVDDPGTVTITNIVITLPGSNSRYISGVPSLENGEIIYVDLRVVNAVRKHYAQTTLAIVSGSDITSLSLSPPGAPPSEGANVDYSSEEVTVSGDTYSEDVALAFVGYNSKAVAGTSNPQTTSARKDEVSDETGRMKAGEGNYPSSGYGTSYDSTVVLDDAAYDEELQLLNGLYQWPTGDYSSNLPDAGPDYSGLSGSGTRRCIPIGGKTTISNATSLTFTIQGAVGFSSIVESDFILQVKVDGVTGWLDANAAYPGAGAPSSDGDACLDIGNSTSTVKRITFGPTPRSGTVYIRIGLVDADSKKFSGILIS